MLTPIALLCANAMGADDVHAPVRRWVESAEEMRKQALSWGDQAYGAVLVKDNRIIGYGPSRVVKNNDPEAHAEREAIKHALASVGAQAVAGAVLYSTSRPCRACELAAAKAGVQRMYFGQTAQDAGTPKGG
jgi:tRNA(Arg) A34 adenosine deaminase TadA